MTGLTRRDLLAGSAALGAAVALGPAVKTAPPPMAIAVIPPDARLVRAYYYYHNNAGSVAEAWAAGLRTHIEADLKELFP